MKFMTLFTVIAGSISCIIFYIIYSRKRKHDKLLKGLFIKLPKIFGIVNLLLGIGMGLFFINNPEQFEAQENITWNVGTVLFSLFAIYFHILALPISIGELMVTILLKRDNIIKLSDFYISIITNSVAVVILFILTILILN